MGVLAKFVLLDILIALCYGCVPQPPTPSKDFKVSKTSVFLSAQPAFIPVLFQPTEVCFTWETPYIPYSVGYVTGLAETTDFSNWTEVVTLPYTNMVGGGTVWLTNYNPFAFYRAFSRWQLSTQ